MLENSPKHGPLTIFPGTISHYYLTSFIERLIGVGRWSWVLTLTLSFINDWKFSKQTRPKTNLDRALRDLIYIFFLSSNKHDPPTRLTRCIPLPRKRPLPLALCCVLLRTHCLLSFCIQPKDVVQSLFVHHTICTTAFSESPCGFPCSCLNHLL